MAETSGEGNAAGFILPALLGAGQAIGGLINSPKNRYKWNKRAAQDSNAMNRENQQWMLDQEKALQEEQRRYDSPEAQMQRYIAAGLNPHLIYGNGSSAGNAFPIHAGNLPGVNIDAVGPSPNYVGDFIAGATSAVRANQTVVQTEESMMRQQAIALQVEIAKTNPMLNPSVAEAVSSAMEETSRLKMVESRYWLDKSPEGTTRVGEKVRMEVEALAQRLGLNTSDLAIKNKILESKEFENVVKELNAKWLRDADITPEHIRQGLMLLLSKMK